MDALPTEIQNTILSHLPSRDLVSTSILSRPWRRRWESVPHLDIDLDLAGVVSWNTATTFLDRCAAPVRRVHLHGIPPHLAASADSWIRLVAGKKLRSLCMNLPASALPPALPAVFSCDAAALAELSLRSCSLPAPPAGFAGFHALATLSLDRIYFLAENGWKQVEAMLAAAAGLQELTLKHVIFHVGNGDLPGRWVIGGPRLRRLELCLRIAGAGLWELGALPKLEYASLLLNDSPADRGYSYVKVLTALSGVRELYLANFDGTTYQAPLLTGSLSRKFQNLMVLKLETHFYALSTYISTWSLLQEAPLLQVLEIMDYFRDGEVNELDLVAGCMHTTLLPYCGLFKNLAYLRMTGISCSVNDMYFIKHVLHMARNLKEVSVHMFERSRKSAQEASRELKECQRPSAAARVSIKHGDSVWDV